MKKVLIGAAFVASALVAAMPAQAASVIQCQSGPGNCQVTLDDGNTTIQFSGSVTNGQVTVVPFTDIYGFNLGNGTATITFTSSSTGPSNDIDFSLVQLDGPGGIRNIPQVIGDPSETYQLNNFAVTSGAYTFTVTGAAGTPGQFVNGTYSGNISFTPSPAVPEPATWAMMIGGLGIVGGAMRRSRKAKMVTA